MNSGRNRMNLFCEFVFVFSIVLNQATRSAATCYFQQEFQGEYKMQSSNLMDGIQYTTLNITDSSIPIWGNCHKKFGNNFILMLNFSGTTCIRCLHLKLRSSSVLQVIASSQETISKCYTNETLAESNCPTDEAISSGNVAEILLFKTKNSIGGNAAKAYCPIHGTYRVSYKTKTNECSGGDSLMDTCPSGSTLNFRLKNCSTNNRELKFDCLGSWSGPKNETVLIFIDNRYESGQKPKYRCAFYKEDLHRTIYMAISKDSTCTTELSSATHGHEMMVLTPKEENRWPTELSFSRCHFPDWMQGSWEHVTVNDDKLIYTDYSSFKTYTVRCVAIQEEENKFLVYTRTQCGEDHYTCMKISKRSNDILEFQLGINFSETNNVYYLCSNDSFVKDSWITQGRIDTTTQGMCPISGEFTGVIPDEPALCAKLWSDCDAREQMYYQVSHCETGEVYEEREYKCLGHWKESDLLYTYTQRKDVAAGTYECFVGSIFSEEEIFIKEAGEHCQRNIDPSANGMNLRKKGFYSCIAKMSTDDQSTVKSTPQTPVFTTTLRTVAFTKSTRRPWNFDNDASEPKKEVNCSAHLKHVFLTYLILLTLPVFL